MLTLLTPGDKLGPFASAAPTAHGGLVGAEELPHLFADRREELGRRGSLRDERSDSPQRRLLVGKPSERGP